MRRRSFLKGGLVLSAAYPYTVSSSMTTYNTGNPIGSESPKDLYDNAQNLDILLNHPTKTKHPDRLGVPRATWHGMEQDFQQVLETVGYVGTGSDGKIQDYDANGPITITAINQVFIKDSEFYKLKAGEALPYTTTDWATDESNMVAMGDNVLRSDLAGTLKSGKGGFLVRGSAIYVDTLTSLKALPASSLIDGQVVNVTTGVRAGQFVVKSGSPPADPREGVYVSLGSGRFAERVITDFIYPDWFGTDGTRPVDSAALRAAISFANGAAIKLRKKRYYYDGVRIEDSKLRIHGSGTPEVNSAKTALENGSIIDGTFGFASTDVDLRDFGVDVGASSSAPEGDAIRGTAPINAGGTLHTENIVGLCKSPSSAYHALLFQSYTKHTGDNLLGVYGLFGFVSKSQNVDLGLVHSIENNESGVLLKSDVDYGRCRNVSLQRVRCDGATNQKRGFHVQSADDNLRNVQVGMVETNAVDEGVLIQVASAGVELRNIDITTILSKNSRIVDLRVDNRNAAAPIFNVHIGHITTENTTTYGIRVEGDGDVDKIDIESAFVSYGPSATQTQMDNAVVIGSNCIGSRIGNLKLIKNFSLTAAVGGITYNTTVDNREKHVLGSHMASVFGNPPRPGYSSVTITGTGNTLLVPRNFSGQNYSLSQAVPTAAGAEINNFGSTPNGSDNFQVGHVFTVYNGASSQSLKVLNSPAGGILNKGGLAVTIPPQEVVSWIHTGSGAWRQM